MKNADGVKMKHQMQPIFAVTEKGKNDVYTVKFAI